MAKKKKVVKKKAVAKSRPVVKPMRKALRPSPEDRMVGNATMTPTPAPLVVEDDDLSNIEIAVTEPSPVIVEMVKCRYCGASMPKPSDGSTFYTDGCVTTGEPVFDEVGRRIA